MNIQDMESVDEQLTAYLDGELSTVEATELERKLVDNESLRLRLAELRRAYDLLDELPETPHNQRFTRSTLELVVKDLSATRAAEPASPSVVSFKRSWWAWPHILLLMAAFLLCGAVVGFAMRVWRVQSEISDLGLIASLPGMLDVSELKVAIELSQDTEAIEVIKKHLGDRLVPSIPDSVWQRKTWIDGLTPLKIAKLDAGRETMRKLDPATYKRLVAFESQIESRPDSHHLQDTIHVIGLVMDRLPNSKRLDLEGLDTAKRIQYLRDELYLAAAISYASNMSQADARELEEWDAHSFRPALVQEIQPSRTMDTKELLNVLLFRRRLEYGFQLDNQNELIDELTPKLSETGRVILSKINRNDQLRILFAWLAPERVNNSQALIDGYDKINPAIKDRIDLSDPEQSKFMLEEIVSRPGPRRSRP